MARYRKVDIRMWGDTKFNRLSPLLPSGQSLWLYLLLNPDTTAIPGLFRAGRAGMAEALGWKQKAFDEAFRELMTEGLAEADWDNRVVWIPNAIIYNKPESPNVVTGWAIPWEELPECGVKFRAHQQLRAFIGGLDEAFLKAFIKACPLPFVKTSPNQEQEHEQEHLQEQEVPPKAPRGEGGGETKVKKRKSGMRIDQVPPDAVARFVANVWPNVRARSGTPKKKQDALLVYAQIDPAEWGEVETAVKKYYSDDEFTKGDGKPVDLVRFLETGKGVETWREWVTVEPALSPGERIKRAKGCDVCDHKGYAMFENTSYRCRCDKGALMYGGKGGQLTEAEYDQLKEKVSAVHAGD